MDILILGGTRYVGHRLCKLLEAKDGNRIFVASRRWSDSKNSIVLERKNEKDLEEVFLSHHFDVVIDFINFSALDSHKLISAIKNSGQKPHLISISTSYVYADPEKLRRDKIYIEEDFIAEDHTYNLKDNLGYTEGKRAMEGYLAKNYSHNKSTVVRFPIILGADDYTGRTSFFKDFILKNKKICFQKDGMKSNYVFSEEAAKALLFFVSTCSAGTFNVVMEPALDEREIFRAYCEFYGKEMGDYINRQGSCVISPFYYRKDFQVNGSKFHDRFKFDCSFHEALGRELDKMK